MRRTTLGCLCLFLVIIFPFGLMAADNIAEADKLFRLDGLENYKQAIELLEKELAANPDSYEANWIPQGIRQKSQIPKGRWLERHLRRVW